MKLYYEIASTKNIEFRHSCFEGYPDITYLTKISKLNRPAVLMVTEDNFLLGCIVMSKHGRTLKINLLCVHELGRRKKIGYRLLNQVLIMANDDFFGVDRIYTVCPHQFNTNEYQDLLVRNNFILTTVKANGDFVYTYAKPIQESYRKD